jgi:hypothetical protein
MVRGDLRIVARVNDVENSFFVVVVRRYRVLQQ